MQCVDHLHAWITSRTPSSRSCRQRPLPSNPTPTLSCNHPAHLEGDFSCYGEAVSDDGLFFRGATFPAVQFNAAAPWQENLLVHLNWRVPCELAGCTPHTHTHTNTASGHCFIDSKRTRTPTIACASMFHEHAVKKNVYLKQANLIPLSPLVKQLPRHISSVLSCYMVGTASKWEEDLHPHFWWHHSFLHFFPHALICSSFFRYPSPNPLGKHLLH